jgi:poly-gamma-glutamate capsule biosynthesis protein CapA/YwtB (metallophosphatase superfamily)
MKEVEPILKNADVTIGNLEGVLLDQGGIAKTCHNPKVCYVFRSPERYVQNLVNAGFDALSLANNHASDFGYVGMQSSIRTLEKAGLYHAGQTLNPYATFEKDGIEYGFIAFAPNTGCNNINDIVMAKKMVAHLDSIADIVIVSFHGGAEGPDHQHVTRKNEWFYSENRGNVYQFAHAVIDAGADVVFGHGPHVTRAVEIYKNKFIAYSLGNFCTYAGINVSGVTGLSPIIKVYTDGKGFFLKANVTSTKQSFLSSVKLDSQNQVLKRIQELTKSDFPEGGVSIDSAGWVMKSTK